MQPTITALVFGEECHIIAQSPGGPGAADHPALGQQVAHLGTAPVRR